MFCGTRRRRLTRSFRPRTLPSMRSNHGLLFLLFAPVACTQNASPVAKPEPASVAKTEPAPLAEGAPAPELTLKLQDGSDFVMKDHAAELVLVYFYPKDDTPGCTVEAQGMRDTFPELTAAGVKVLGVSEQDAASHQAFIEKHSLPFALVVDDGSVAKAFGVAVNNGFAARQSFLLKGGKVIKAWHQVTPSAHAAEVLAAAKAAA